MTFVPNGLRSERFNWHCGICRYIHDLVARWDIVLQFPGLTGGEPTDDFKLINYHI